MKSQEFDGVSGRQAAKDVGKAFLITLFLVAWFDIPGTVGASWGVWLGSLLGASFTLTFAGCLLAFLPGFYDRIQYGVWPKNRHWPSLAIVAMLILVYKVAL